MLESSVYKLTDKLEALILSVTEGTLAEIMEWMDTVRNTLFTKGAIETNNPWENDDHAGR